MTVRVTEILVCKDVLVDEDDPNALPEAVWEFVDALLESFYKREELPRPAVVAAHLIDYYGEVMNGGFAQYVANWRWAPDRLTGVRQALELAGDRQHLRLFDKLCQRVAMLGPDLLRSLQNGSVDMYSEPGCRRIIRFLNAGDRIFCRLERDKRLLRAMGDYLTGRTELKVLEREELKARMECLVDAMHRLVHTDPEYEPRFWAKRPRVE